MAKKKKKQKPPAALVRRPDTKPARKPAPPAARSTSMAKKKTRSRRVGNPGLKSAIATVAGGAAGALVTGFLTESIKVKPKTAGLLMSAAGLVGAATLNGTGRWFSAGVATSGATALTATYVKEYQAAALLAPAEGRGALLPAARPELTARNETDIETAFQLAREEQMRDQMRAEA